MTAILKVDTIQDTSGNNIINESSDTITIGAAGDTIDVPGTEVKTNKVSPTSGTGLQLGDSGDTITIPSGATITNSGTASGFGGLSMVDQWRMTADKSNVGTSNTVFDSNLEQIDTSGQSTVGSAMTESSGVFTFPSTGKYLIIAKTNYYRDSDRRFCKLQIDIGVGGSFTQLAQGYGHIKVINSNHTYINVICSTIVAIGNTSNDTVRFVGAGDGEITAEGSTSTNKTTFTFIKLN